MRKSLMLAMAMTVLMVVGVAVWSDEAGEAPKVSLTAQDQPVLAVAMDVQNQSGVQVAVLPGADAPVSLEVKDARTEDAVKALCEAFDGSWMRAYIIESAPPDPAYTAEELAAAMGEFRRAWMESLTDEQRQALFARWREAGEARRQQAQAEAQAQGEAGAEGQQAQGGRPNRRRMEDPIRRLELPARYETVTLKLDSVPFLDAVYRFIYESGYLALPQQGLEGTVTVDLQDVPVQDALDQIAAAAGAKSRPFYLVGMPREIPQQEMQARQEQGFQRMWTDFWQQPPDERARRIEGMVERIRNAPAGGRGDRFARFAPRMLSRLTQYSATLDPERRMELKPLLQAIGERINQQQ